jgi:hypothetical protein
VSLVITTAKGSAKREYRAVVRDSHSPWFMFYTYGFDLSDSTWLVYIVMTLIVCGLFGCVFTPILVVTLCIPFCVDHLTKRHMMCVHFESFTGLLYIIVISRHFSPGSRLLLFGFNKIIIISYSQKN